MKIDFEGKDCIAEDYERAMQVLREKHNVTVYNYDIRKLEQIVIQMEEAVKKENGSIDDVNKQTILTNPYHFEAIDGCLHVHAAEISSYLFEEVNGTIAFGGWNTRVLSKPVRMTIGLKALESLYLLGTTYEQGAVKKKGK